MEAICKLDLMLQQIQQMWKKESNEELVEKREEENIIRVRNGETRVVYIIPKKRPTFRCYNCRERGHIMRNCPFSPRAIKIEILEHNKEMKADLAYKPANNGRSINTELKYQETREK